jgi:hypothetical protein
VTQKPGPRDRRIDTAIAMVQDEPSITAAAARAFALLLCSRSWMSKRNSSAG